MMNEIKELFNIIAKLHKKYPHRDFTLDGRLVGDIGEIIAENAYEITLYPSGKKKYDGYSGNKQVQIKTTFKDSLTFPHGKANIPDYYLGIKLFDDGHYEEVYNGPGKNIWELLKACKQPKTGMHSISISRLKSESKKIDSKDKILKKEILK